jgi:3-oxoadipate CoA-transferase alpha subunit
MLGGFGNAGMPGQLIEALRRRAVKNLTIISNGAGTGGFALGGHFADGLVKKLIASFPAPTAADFRDKYLKAFKDII